MGANSSKNEEKLKKYLNENDYYNVLMFVNNDKNMKDIKLIDGMSPLMYYYRKHIYIIENTKLYKNSFDNEYGILKKLFDIYKNDITEYEYQKIDLLLNVYFS